MVHYGDGLKVDHSTQKIIKTGNTPGLAHTASSRGVFDFV